jgi:hypothetical protein
MMTPSLHLNGTTRDVLLDQTVDAIGALRTAIEAVMRIAPHARDYYPQGPDAFTKARAEHQQRLACLVTLKEQYETFTDAIIDAETVHT